MKKLIWIMPLLLVLPAPAVHGDEAGSGWGGSLGVTSWFPDWSSGQSHFNADSTGLFGPLLFLHYRNAGIGFQYFTGDFDLLFPGSISEITADRTDFDVMLSYRIARIFQVSALYKSIRYDWHQTFDVESTITGFGVGGGINKVFPNRILAYGFGFLMPSLDYHQNVTHGATYNGDADGFWIEGGIGYIVPYPQLMAKIGYRYQRIDIESGSSDWDETTDGFRFDVSYYF